MHQLAYGLYINKILNYSVYIDNSFLNFNHKLLGITKRRNELYAFDLLFPEFNKFWTSHFVFIFLNRFTGVKFICEYLFSVKICNSEQEMLDIHNSKRTGSHVLLNGLFGKSKYYDTIKADLFKLFSFKSKKILQYYIDKVDKNCNSVSVHIRRTDYQNTNSVHTLLDRDYYEKAIRLVSIKAPESKFYFFGDDKEWIRQNFDFSLECNILIDENLSTFDDFQMMMHCSDMIISNSTFSWWSAYLSAETRKLIIAPQKWFKTDSMNLNVDLPASWVRI